MKLKSWQHIAFWLVVFGLLILILADWFQSYRDAFLYLSFLFPVIVGTAYFFNYFLVPRYLFPRRFPRFFLYSFYMLVVSLCLELISAILAFLTAVQYGINDKGILITDIFTLGGLLYFVVLLFSFLMLSKHYFLDQKAIGELQQKQELAARGWLSVRSGGQNQRIELNKLLYLESLADYLRFHLSDGDPLESKMKISHIEKDLPATYLRIHRSYIVNSAFVTSFRRDHVMIGETELPMSRTYGQKAYEALKHRS